MAFDVILSIVAKIGEYLVQPIGRQFGYLIYYNSNTENLKNQVEKLVGVRGGVQLLVDAAKRNGEVIGPDVERWLTSVDGIREEVGNFFEDEVQVHRSCFNGWSPDLRSRCSLSKKAKKKMQFVVELQGYGKFERISYPAPPLGIRFTTQGGSECLETRVLTMKGIMEALKDDNINAIGICGMGGVGKTTMVKEVAKRAEGENLFDDIVMAVVSQTPNLKEIQGEIADMLGLKFTEESLSGRANRLYARLKDGKRSLVILDDVWARLNLEAIGIPFGGDDKGCKIMLTSRNQDVCSEMGTQNIFTIEVLSKREAWNLFREMAGNCIDTPSLRTIAKEIVNECGGLPIALITVGRALESKSKLLWNDALQQLRKSIPKNITGMHANVYSTLELSYNCLESEEAKSCFLLCCLFPEDSNISIGNLARYGMGLRLFEEIDTLGEARDRTHTLVDKLRSCNLLLDSDKEGYVKMHDVVRDVAIAIASSDEHNFMIKNGAGLKEWPEKDTYKHYTAISLMSNEMQEIPGGLECPKLKLLLLACSNRSLKTPDNLVEGMKELKVLHLMAMFIPSLPPSLRFLTNLRTLGLDNCKLRDISVIGEVQKLEILSFNGSNIEVLPREIGQLTHLRLLDLTDCAHLRIISPGVLSSLSRLEELYMQNSFLQWEVDEEGKERSNASLMELKSLSHLTALDIHIPNGKFLPRDLLFENVMRFNISIGRKINDWGIYQFQNHLGLKLEASVPLEGGINVLLKRSEILSLEVKGSKNVIYELGGKSFVHLKALLLHSCDEVEYFINTMDHVPSIAFPVLESLNLSNLVNFKEICHGQVLPWYFCELREVKIVYLPALMHLWKSSTQNSCLRNLTVVEIRDCDRLKNLFPKSMARGLVQLQRLVILECRMVEEIASDEIGEDEQAINNIMFPQLSYLRLEGLPNLTSFCKGIGEIDFPQLNYLFLQRLPKLRSFCPKVSTLASEHNHDTTIQPLFDQKEPAPAHGRRAMDG